MTKRHRKLRLQFAKKYKTYTQNDWMRVIWSDETKINRLGKDGRQWIWRKPREPLTSRIVQPTVKFGGGNVMMWGCMRMEGVGECVRVAGRMDANQYVDILQQGLCKSLEVWGKNVSDVIFQQDNDPKHTSRVAKAWLQNNGFEVLDWPPQSPDLNPIEHAWVEVKRAISDDQSECQNLDDLWQKAKNSWQNISGDFCRKVVESMPKRIEAVIKAKGGHIKY